jgi:hypothetical protein
MSAEPELAELLPVVGAHLGGPIVRVSLSMESWNPEQPRRIRVDGRLVRLGWFRTIDPAIVTLGRTTFDRRTLLVISATLPEPTGRLIVERLAAAPRWPDSVRSALAGTEAG